MEGAIDYSLPDTSIAYRLYLECGRMINLYDWFLAFEAILERGRSLLKQKNGEMDDEEEDDDEDGKGQKLASLNKHRVLSQ